MALFKESVGRYRLLNMKASGQVSQVWEVVENSSSRHFAMKILLPEHSDNKEHRSMLYQEADIGLKLAHPNIIKIQDVVKNDPANVYFVMEFFPSGALRERLRQKDTEFIKAQAQSIFKQTATALAYMNANGWVHRDVKPDNILVNAAGEVKLIDFAISIKIPTGLSKLFHRKGNVMGTRSYMSPEQIHCEALDGRADIYSFGASCYEVVAGRPPFVGLSNQDLLNKHLYDKPVSPQIYNKDVTDDFAKLILKMIAKKREDRPANFHQVLMDMKKMRVFRSAPVARKPKAAEPQAGAGAGDASE